MLSFKKYLIPRFWYEVSEQTQQRQHTHLHILVRTFACMRIYINIHNLLIDKIFIIFSCTCMWNKLQRKKRFIYWISRFQKGLRCDSFLWIRSECAISYGDATWLAGNASKYISPTIHCDTTHRDNNSLRHLPSPINN